MSKAYQIINGWSNLLKSTFNVLDIQTKKISEERLSHCRTCDLMVNNICSSSKKGYHVVTGVLTSGCGCPVRSKSMSMRPDTKCPLGKW